MLSGFITARLNAEVARGATLVMFSQVVQRVLGGVEALDRDLRVWNISQKPFQHMTLSDSGNTSSQEILAVSGLACGTIREIGPTYL